MKTAFLLKYRPKRNMKLLLVTLVVVTVIAVNIREIDAIPGGYGGEPLGGYFRADRMAPGNFGAERKDNVAPADRGHEDECECDGTEGDECDDECEERAMNVATSAEGE